MEVGGGQAMLLGGEFLAQPAPEVSLTEATSEYYQQKLAFERERLSAWF
jgi:hypothetical protein